jgi:hydrogenase/urease accessory protein HupE
MIKMKSAKMFESGQAGELLVLRAWLSLIRLGERTLQTVRDRMVWLSVTVMSSLGAALAIDGSGNNAPDVIIAGAVCGGDGWLTWFTSLKFLVVILVAGMVGFFIGRAIGNKNNEGIMGSITAVLGLGAIRILVKVVTQC